VLIDGEWQVIGGTGATAPMWAGLILLFNQLLNTRLGCVAPMLYSVNKGGASDQSLMERLDGILWLIMV
jgi:subtilase family serine protease